MDKRLVSGSRSITRASPVSGEVYELPRICSMFDKPYVARFLRSADGYFRLLDTAKFESGNEKGDAAPKRVNLTASQTAADSPTERCVWCGSAGHPIHCARCGFFMCPGQFRKRDRRDYFRCRASCGNEGYLDGVADSCEGWQGAPPVKRLEPTKGQSQAELPKAPSRLRLKS